MIDIMGNKTIIDLLHEKCSQYGEKSFLVYENNQKNTINYTYNDFYLEMKKFSNVFYNAGIEKNDKVILHLPNSADFILSWFALANIGAIMVPTNILYTSAEMEYFIKHSESKLIVTEEQYLDKFKGRRNILLTRYENEKNLSKSMSFLKDYYDYNLPDININSDDVVSIMYTSGTTSKPKGCLITHANYIYTGEVVSKTLRFSVEDRSLIVLPLFHGNGQYYMFMPSLTVGGSIIIMENFSASQYIKQAKKHKATIGSLFAAPIRMILSKEYDNKDYENFLRVVVFAQSLTKKQLEEFEKRYDTSLLQLYGMTETVAPPLMNPLDGLQNNYSLGKPVLSTNIKLIDEKEKDITSKQAGQLVVSGTPGRTIMKGYFKNKKETDKVIKNGWFLTGDYAQLTEEGFLTFVDRGKDIIKKAGENIAAVEIENVIMENANIYETAVIGVEHPVYDKVIKAFVILKQHHSLSKEEVIKHCKKSLSKFKIPDVIEFVDDLPRTSVGKIQKHKLKNKNLS